MRVTQWQFRVIGLSAQWIWQYGQNRVAWGAHSDVIDCACMLERMSVRRRLGYERGVVKFLCFDWEKVFLEVRWAHWMVWDGWDNCQTIVHWFVSGLFILFMFVLCLSILCLFNHLYSFVQMFHICCLFIHLMIDSVWLLEFKFVHLKSSQVQKFVGLFEISVDMAFKWTNKLRNRFHVWTNISNTYQTPFDKHFSNTFKWTCFEQALFEWACLNECFLIEHQTIEYNMNIM